LSVFDAYSHRTNPVAAKCCDRLFADRPGAEVLQIECFRINHKILLVSKSGVKTLRCLKNDSAAVLYQANVSGFDRQAGLEDYNVPEVLDGGALVSTWEMRQRRHAEDGSLASLKIEPKQTANQELALAA